MIKFFLVTFLFALIWTPAFAQEDIGFTQNWSVEAKNFDINSYQGIYVDKINLKDLKVRTIDDDGDVSQNYLGEDTWNSLALTLYQVFVDELKTLRPLLEPEHKTNGEVETFSMPALGVNIKISGIFEQEELRLLTKLIRGNPKVNKTVPLDIKCEIFEATTKKPVVKFIASSDFTTTNIENPFSSLEDIEQIETLGKLWARRVVNLIKSDKEAEPIPDAH